jgi:uncharacterized membrane protein
MSKTRLEAFSDGVIAILITIMVLELKQPHGDDLHALAALAPVFCAYVLSFVFLGIYWNNHHHMLHATTHINGKILWLNLHLLFWLSLVPFTTAWIGETHLARLPTAVYGIDMLLAAVAYTLLQNGIIADQGEGSKLAAAVGSDVKGKISGALYAVGIAIAFYEPPISAALYVVVAIIWFIPDRRIERKLHNHDQNG